MFVKCILSTYGFIMNEIHSCLLLVSKSARIWLKTEAFISGAFWFLWGRVMWASPNKSAHRSGASLERLKSLPLVFVGMHK